MAGKDNKAPSFDDMIQAGRARKKNEQLAAEIFGRNRNGKNNSSRGDRSASNSPSLASRVGIAKRSSSSTSTSSQRNPFRPSPSRNTSTQSQRERGNRLSHALNSSISSKPQPQGGLSIKGKAGPWTIIASNFAPGTTAADIEATLSRDALDSDGQNGLLSCKLASTKPAVSAELVVSERVIGDRLISVYNNQMADGRYLKLDYKTQQLVSTPAFTSKNAAPPPEPEPAPEQPVYAEDTDMMPVDDLDKPPASENHPYDDEREAAAASRDRRDRESRRDDQDRDRDGGRREGDRDRRFDDRSYDRRYDDRPRYDDRSYGRGGGRGDGRGDGRGYGGGVRGGYARAAGMAGSGGPRGGQYRGNYR